MDKKINRAAQFMPFDALKGLQEELRRREELHSRSEKREMDEETLNEISVMLNRIRKGDFIEVDFFFNGHSVKTSGKVIDKKIAEKILVLDNISIDFEDIYKITIIEK